jgi:cytochrome c oxidase subunit III
MANAATAPVSTALEEQFDDLEQQKDAASLGLWVFLATEVLFFGGLLASYTISRIRYADAFAAASRHTDFLWGTVETGVLLTSSLTMACAVRAARLGGRHRVTALLGATILLGAVFFGIHLHEYRHDYQAHLIPGFGFAFEPVAQAAHAQLFFFLYYVTTLLHLTHLTLGIVVLGVIACINARGRYSRDYYTPIEIAGLYWHFVDVVWVFLYPLFYLIARGG